MRRGKLEIVLAAASVTVACAPPYFSPNKTIAELHEEINRDKLDPLSDFSRAREELATLKW